MEKQELNFEKADKNMLDVKEKITKFEEDLKKENSIDHVFLLVGKIEGAMQASMTGETSNLAKMITAALSQDSSKYLGEEVLLKLILRQFVDKLKS